MSFSRRQTMGLALGGVSAAIGRPAIVGAQTARELVIITYPGKLSEPHRWLADQMEARHAGLQGPAGAVRQPGHRRTDQGGAGLLALRRDAERRAAASDRHPRGLHREARRRGAQEPRRGLSGAAREEPGLRRARDLFACRHRLQYRAREEPARELGRSLEAASSRARSASRAPRPISASRRSPSPPRPSAARRTISSQAGSGSRCSRPRRRARRRCSTQMLEREEIAIAPLWNNNTAAAAEKGLPIRFVMPKPGAIAIISFFSAIASTRHPDLVNEWLDGILSPAYQARAAGVAVLLRADRARRRRCRTRRAPTRHRRPKRCWRCRPSTGPRSCPCAANSSNASTAPLRCDRNFGRTP